MVNVTGLRQLLNTSSFRQASTVAFISLVVALLLILCSNQLLEAIMRSHVRDMILNDIRTQQLQGNLSQTERVISALRNRNSFDNHRERYAVVLDAKHRTLYGDSRTLPQQAPSQDLTDNWYDARRNDDLDTRTQILGLLVPLGDGGLYFSAYDLQPMLERTRMIPLIAGAALLFVLLLILSISLPFSHRNLVRVNRIRNVLMRYTSGDQGARVHSQENGDEFDQLGQEVNHSLQRIDRLMAEVKTVTSHIAHELRTPLTRLQARLLDLSEQMQGESRLALLEAVQDSERIQCLFRSVMRIAEVETGRCLHQFQIISARALLEEVQEYYQPLAEERNVELLIDCPWELPLYGDRSLLFQALANLLDNALKYAPCGLPISLTGHRRGQKTYLSIADRGPGIPPQSSANALKRFGRLENGHRVPGNGLGLTLVQAVCELHDATLHLDDHRPGLIVRLELRQAPRLAKAEDSENP